MHILMTTDQTYDFKSVIAMIGDRNGALRITLAHAYYDGNIDRCIEEFKSPCVVRTDDDSVVHAFEFHMEGDPHNDDVFYIHSGHVTDELFNEVTMQQLLVGKPVNFDRLRLSANAVEIGNSIQLMLNECSAYLGRPVRIYGLTSSVTSRIVPVAFYGPKAAACAQLINSKLDI